MKLFYFLLLIFLFSCSQLERSPSSLPLVHKDIVFDIDWTITSEVKELKGEVDSIIVEGKSYVIQDYLRAIIEDLASRPEVRISFYSGGSKERNQALLSAIKLKDGRSLFDIAWKVLNKDDLVVMKAAGPEAKFNERYKKDLRKINTDLSNVVMIDDNKHFLLDKSQEDHLIWTGKTYQYFGSFEDATKSSGQYVPRTFEEWSLGKYKLSVIHGAMINALKRSHGESISFNEAIQREKEMMNLESSVWNDYSKKMLSVSFKTYSCEVLVKSLIAP